jgi:hypothetical protein
MCEFEICNHRHDKRLIESRLRVPVPENVRFIESSLIIQGERRALPGSVGDELRLLLAPFATLERRAVAFELCLDSTAMLEHGSPFELLAELITPSSDTLVLDATATIDARVTFNPSYTLAEVEGPAEAHIGDERNITIVAVNDGTIPAHAVVLDLRPSDIDVFDIDGDFQDLPPGDVRLVRARGRITGPEPAISPILRYSTGEFEMEPVALTVTTSMPASTRELIAGADNMFAANGTAVLTAHGHGPFELRSFALSDDPVAREQFIAHVEVFHAADQPAQTLELRFTPSRPLAFAGHFTVNGVDVTITEEEPVLRLRDVAPRTLIDVGIALLSDVATIGDERVLLAVRATWEGGEASAVLLPFTIAPKIIAASLEADLPFTIDRPNQPVVATGGPALPQPYIEEDTRPNNGLPTEESTGEPGLRLITPPYDAERRDWMLARLSGVIHPDTTPTLFGIIGTLHAFSPATASADIPDRAESVALERAYSSARIAFDTLVNPTIMRLMPYNQTAPRAEQITAFRSASTSLVHLLKDGAGQASEDGLAPSLAACLLAISQTCGLQFSNGSELRLLARDFVVRLQDFLGESPADDLELQLTDDAPSALAAAASDLAASFAAPETAVA